MPVALLTPRRQRFFRDADGVLTILLYALANEPITVDWTEEMLPGGEFIASSTWVANGPSISGQMLSAVAGGSNTTQCTVTDGFGELRNTITTSTGRKPTTVIRIRDAAGCSGIRDYGG